MEFTEKEMALIKRAKMKSMQVKIMRFMIFGGFIVGFLLYLFHFFSAKEFAFFAIFFAFASLLQPQIQSGPKYEELVDLLSKKSSMIDPIISDLLGKKSEI